MVTKLKSIVKAFIGDNEMIMSLITGLYNVIHHNNAWRFKSKNKICYRLAYLKNVKFDIKGENNEIIIGPKTHLWDCKILIYGNNCKLKLNGGYSGIWYDFLD